MCQRNGALLLHICSTCLQEVSSLRREVREALARINPAQATGAETPPPPPLQAISDPETRRREELRSSCAVDNAEFREQLVLALESGQLSVSMSELLERAKGSAGGAELLAKAAREEVRRGGVGALAVVDGEVKTDAASVEAALAREEERGDSCGGEGSFDSGTRSCVVLWPLFRRASTSLAEALINRCHQERMLPPLELVLEALRAFLSASDSKAIPEESDLLVAVSDALAQQGPSGAQRATLKLAPSGRIVVSKDQASDFLPGYVRGDEATAYSSSFVDGEAPGFAESLEHVREQLEPHLDLLSTVCGGSGEAAAGKGAGEDQGTPASPGVLLGLLGVLRSLSSALELPEALVCERGGGAVLWAYERATAGQCTKLVEGVAGGALTERDEEKEAARRARPTGLGLRNMPLPDPFGDSSEASSPVSRCKSPTVRVMVPIGRDGASSPLEGLDGAECASSCSEQELKRGAGEGGHSGQDLKSETQVLFVECFKEDLVQNRDLLMSQINNLFKMRNGGKILQYKLAGYDKLHDFLLDIPGLEPTGAGNKMKIKIVDVPKFEAFCTSITEGRDVPRFDRPEPVPQSFQWRVIEVFRRSGSREIPAKNFRDVWNCCFPTEKLHCKDFGYRDVRGLLANVSVIEKVGSKSNTRYVLKDEVDFAEHLERSPGGMSTGALPISVDVSEGVQPCKVPMGGEFAVHSSHPLHVGLMESKWQSGPEVMWGAQASGPSRSALAQQQVVQAPVAMPGASQYPPQRLGGHLEDAQPAFFRLQQQLRSRQAMRPTSPIRRSTEAQQVQLQASQAQQLKELQASQAAHSQNANVQYNINPGMQGLVLPPSLLSDLQPRLASPATQLDPARLGPSPPGCPSPPGLQGTLQWTDGLRQQQVPLAPSRNERAAPGPGAAVTRPPPQGPPELQDVDPELSSGLSWLPRSRGSAADEVAPPQLEPWAPPGQAQQAAPGHPVGQQDSAQASGVHNPTAGPVYLQTDIFRTAGASALEGVPPTVPEDAADVPNLPPSVPETASVAPMTAAEYRRQRRMQKNKSSEQKQACSYFSAPGAISSEDRDASKCQGKFDMNSLYQGQISTDHPCMILDFSSGLVQLSNALCDSLFENLCPLQRRDVMDLIHEEDRLNFSACIMYLSIGKFMVMEPQTMRMQTVRGDQRAIVSGEQMVGSWWRLAINVLDEATPVISLPSVAQMAASAASGAQAVAVAGMDCSHLEGQLAGLGSGLGTGLGSGLDTSPASGGLGSSPGANQTQLSGLGSGLGTAPGLGGAGTTGWPSSSAGSDIATLGVGPSALRGEDWGRRLV